MALDLGERANTALEKSPAGLREVKFCAMGGDDGTMLCADGGLLDALWPVHVAQRLISKITPGEAD